MLFGIKEKFPEQTASLLELKREIGHGIFRCYLTSWSAQDIAIVPSLEQTQARDRAIATQARVEHCLQSLTNHLSPMTAGAGHDAGHGTEG
jgi:hypothetical protein